MRQKRLTRVAAISRSGSLPANPRVARPFDGQRISRNRANPTQLEGFVMMKLSARNQLKGKIASVEKGQTTGHVQVDIGNGMKVMASITNEAIDELQLKVGDEAIAVIKASDVMVAK